MIETKKDGTPRKVGLGLLNPGRRLVDRQGGKLVAVAISYRTEASVQTAEEYGADGITAISSEELKEHSTNTYTAILASLVKKYGLTTVPIDATPTGRNLGPRLSCRLEIGPTTDCTSLDVDAETGNTAWARPAFRGNPMVTILCPDCRPQLGTVRPGVLRKSEAGISRAGIIEKAHFFPKERIRITVFEIIRETASEVADLKGAEIIVSRGRGLDGPDGFKLIRTLADVLGAAVDASRVAVDTGWTSHFHQVGQTGRTVALKTYIACGVSGAIQRMADMDGADCIITINEDPKAPIFGIADYDIVGNLFEVVSVITEEIEKAKT